VSNTDLWITLALLGAYHGLNPAMGWLFAVSNGMQQGSRRGVYRSLIPIAIGHEASIVVVAGLAIGASAVIDPGILRIVAASSLVAFGIFRFVKPHAHFRWTTMSPSNRELTLWSFLMSSAHGAGLIVAPVIVGLQVGADHEHHDVAMMSAAPIGAGALGVTVHVGAMLAVMSVIAIVVYERLGVEVLRKAWLNTDQLWAAAFILAGAWTLFS
jgi:hypothetical protein